MGKLEKKDTGLYTIYHKKEDPKIVTGEDLGKFLNKGWEKEPFTNFLYFLGCEKSKRYKEHFKQLAKKEAAAKEAAAKKARGLKGSQAGNDLV